MSRRANSSTLERDLGRLEGKIDALVTTVAGFEKIIERQAEMDKKVTNHSRDLGIIKLIAGGTLTLAGTLVLQSDFLTIAKTLAGVIHK
jgi:hypothetical protein